MIDVDATKYNRTKAAVISKFKRLLPPAQARDTTRESRWRVLRIAAGFPNLRLHDLRHSFASACLAGGYAPCDRNIAFGHADVKTTARYAHLAEEPVRLAANRISGAIAAAMDLKIN